MRPTVPIDARSRRIVTFDWLTADGYFAGRDGNLNWVVPDDEQAKAAAADGRRLLEDVSTSVKLELLESRTYPSGDVSLRYARRAA